MDISRRIKIRHLEAFVEVARQKSVGRAAITLSLTQPAVTRTIRELEDIVGAALVERDGRGIKLSHQGRGVSVSCRIGPGGGARRNCSACQCRHGIGPPVRIGALPTVSATVMPGAVVDFLASGLKSPLRVITGKTGCCSTSCARAIWTW
jgi:LysR family pca operon transcriptional activator